MAHPAPPSQATLARVDVLWRQCERAVLTLVEQTQQSMMTAWAYQTLRQGGVIRRDELPLAFTLMESLFVLVPLAHLHEGQYVTSWCDLNFVLTAAHLHSRGSST